MHDEEKKQIRRKNKGYELILLYHNNQNFQIQNDNIAEVSFKG